MPFGLNLTQLPSNIGGISIPDAIKGPLSSLYGPGQYDKATLRYPRDLGTNQARKHSIVFTVLKNDPANLTGALSGIGTNLLNIGKEVGNEAARTAAIANDKTLTSQEKAGKFLDLGVELPSRLADAGGSNLMDSFSQAALKLRRKAGTTIGLYVPDNVNVQYSTAYDSNESLSDNLGRFFFLAQGATSLSKAFADQKDKTLVNMLNVAGNDPFVRDLALTTLGTFTGTNLTRLGLNAAGYATNPQLQVLFQSIGFREFTFSFLLTPYSKEETSDIQKIIQTFKYHSAPEIASNATTNAPSLSYYMKVPDAFDIKFYYGNEENNNIHKIGESVLTNVNVDYASGGQWSTFNNGSPSQIRLELSFKETVLIDKNKIGKPGTSEGGY